MVVAILFVFGLVCILWEKCGNLHRRVSLMESEIEDILERQQKLLDDEKP